MDAELAADHLLRACRKSSNSGERLKDNGEIEGMPNFMPPEARGPEEQGLLQVPLGGDSIARPSPRILWAGKGRAAKAK